MSYCRLTINSLDALKYATFLTVQLRHFFSWTFFFNYIIFYFSNSSTFMALWKDEMNTIKYVCVDVLAK